MAGPTWGQNVIIGRVVDFETKSPIKEVTVRIVGTNIETTTNSSGYFQLNADTSNVLLIRCDNYQALQFQVPNVSRFKVELISDLMLEFDNRINEINDFLIRNLKYPTAAIKGKTHGRVYVSFDLDSLNGVQNIKILHDIGNNCGEEVVKVLKTVPNKWMPKSKSEVLILPVVFKMEAGNYKRVGTDIELPNGKLLNEIIVGAPRLY